MQQINGKIVKVLPQVEGENSRGRWVRGGFVIEYGDEYPRTAAFTVYGQDMVDKLSLFYPGILVQVNYQPESREYNDRWYTELRCFRFDVLVKQQ